LTVRRTACVPGGFLLPIARRRLPCVRQATKRVLQIFGVICLTIVVLTHVAETLHLFPGMGWGQPTSIGHYIDLVSAILGCALLLLGFLGRAFTRPQPVVRVKATLQVQGCLHPLVPNPVCRVWVFSPSALNLTPTSEVLQVISSSRWRSAWTEHLGNPGGCVGSPTGSSKAHGTQDGFAKLPPRRLRAACTL
jgi:hypothetical protein